MLIKRKSKDSSVLIVNIPYEKFEEQITSVSERQIMKNTQDILNDLSPVKTLTKNTSKHVKCL